MRIPVLDKLETLTRKELMAIASESGVLDDLKKAIEEAPKGTPFRVKDIVTFLDSARAAVDLLADVENSENQTSNETKVDSDAEIVEGNVVLEAEKASDSSEAVEASNGELPAQVDQPRRAQVQQFAQSVKVKTETRIATSGGDCQFWNPITGKVTENDIPSQWLKVQPGEVVHLISWTETPDAAVVLIEGLDKSGAKTYTGTTLRRASWNKIQNNG